MNLHAFGFVFGAQLFQAIRQRAVVKALLAIGFHQRHDDHGGAEIGCHQRTDFTRTHHVRTQLLDAFGRSVVVVRNDWAALQTFFGHAHPARRGHPKRFHEGTIHTGQQKQLVVESAQRVHVTRFKNRILGRSHCDAQGIAEARQVGLVLLVIDHKRVLAGNHPFEARIHLQAERLITKHQRHHQAHQHHQPAVVEQQSLGP